MKNKIKNRSIPCRRTEGRVSQVKGAKRGEEEIGGNEKAKASILKKFLVLQSTYYPNRFTLNLLIN